MHRTVRLLAARVMIVCLLLYVVPISTLAAGSGARLEGLVIDMDGRPAEASTVYLIDHDGQPQAQVGTDEDGMYSFRDVPAGEYGMGVQTTDGVVAPVSGPPLRLDDGQLVRRDLKLVEADAQMIQQTSGMNYAGGWWSNMSGGEKVGAAIGIVVFVALLIEAFSSEDAQEIPTSPTNPG